MKEIIQLINSPVSQLVEERVKEFLALKNETEERIFSELAFCILTANFSAEKAIYIQEKIGTVGFNTYGIERLSYLLKKYGHRYPEARAKYIVLARRKKKELIKVLKSKNTTSTKREWLVKNIKGIGYKEASHFLRNVGYFEVAILDYHILDLLEKYKVITKPKSMTRKKYMEIEQIIFELSKTVNLLPGILDLYLWYMETGKVLK